MGVFYPLSHSLKKRACPPFPKSATSLERSVPTHMQTASLTDSHRGGESVVRPHWGRSKSELERERREGIAKGGTELKAAEGNFEKRKQCREKEGRQKTKAWKYWWNCACCSSVAAERLPRAAAICLWMEVNLDGLYWQQQSGPHLTPPKKQQTQ